MMDHAIDAREQEPEVAAAETVEPALEWSFNPWRERPVSSWVAAVLCGGILILLLVLGTAPAVAMVMFLALAGSLGQLLLPAHCRVDADGVACRGMFGWERRPWTDIGRAHPVRGGLLVSPFTQPQRLDAFRALLLPMPRARRRSLLAELEPRIKRHGL